MKYSESEINQWINNLLKYRTTECPWGYESDPPHSDDIKSADMLKELIEENKDLKMNCINF